MNVNYCLNTAGGIFINRLHHTHQKVTNHKTVSNAILTGETGFTNDFQTLQTVSELGNVLHNASETMLKAGDLLSEAEVLLPAIQGTRYHPNINVLTFHGNYTLRNF